MAKVSNSYKSGLKAGREWSKKNLHDEWIPGSRSRAHLATKRLWSEWPTLIGEFTSQDAKISANLFVQNLDGLNIRKNAPIKDSLFGRVAIAMDGGIDTRVFAVDFWRHKVGVTKDSIGPDPQKWIKGFCVGALEILAKHFSENDVPTEWRPQV